MNLYAIGDLHLALGAPKPMDIFGGLWDGYMGKLEDEWRRTVPPDGCVLIPGDFCWAGSLEESERDFQFLEGLPGRKILLKGNHDYWWSSITKMDAFAHARGFSGVSFLHNNSFIIDGTAICGTRGWISPDTPGFSPDDEKIYKRELIRLKLSLDSLGGGYKTLIVIMHYPPFGKNGAPLEFLEIAREKGADLCLYGHLHSESLRNAIEGVHGGVCCRLVSSDHLRFRPASVAEMLPQAPSAAHAAFDETATYLSIQDV